MNLQQIKQNFKLGVVLSHNGQFDKGSEFDLLCQYYGVTDTSSGICAKTTGIPYINHILEGIIYLWEKTAGDDVIKAFILHPIFQLDSDLNLNYHRFTFDKVSRRALILTMEYRKVANDYLPVDVGKKEPSLSPIGQVNMMLLADKLQNYKDFLDNKELHIRDRGILKTASLDVYFNNWLDLFRTVERKFSMEEFRGILKENL